LILRFPIQELGRNEGDAKAMWWIGNIYFLSIYLGLCLKKRMNVLACMSDFPKVWPEVDNGVVNPYVADDTPLDDIFAA
jgi:hypothetical protein